MSSVNNDSSSDSDFSKSSVTPKRRPLRATMSLTKFESNDNEAKPLGSAIATPEEFVNKCGGKRVINKILIANNGIAGK